MIKCPKLTEIYIPDSFDGFAAHGPHFLKFLVTPLLSDYFYHGHSWIKGYLPTKLQPTCRGT